MVSIVEIESLNGLGEGSLTIILFQSLLWAGASDDYSSQKVPLPLHK